MCLDGKVSVLVDVVSSEPQGSVLWPILFILYTSELFRIVGNPIEGYADDTKIYVVITRSISCSQVMSSPKQDMAAIITWCLKWHMRLNPEKITFMVVSRSRTSAPGYGEPGALEVKSLS